MRSGTARTGYALARLLAQIALWEFVFALLALLLAWWLGWHSMLGYVNALAFVALAPLALATTSALGGRAAAADLRYHYSRSVMPDSLRDRTYQSMRDLNNALNFSVKAAIVGLTLLISAGVIYVVYWSFQAVP